MNYQKEVKTPCGHARNRGPLASGRTPFVREADQFLGRMIGALCARRVDSDLWASIYFSVLKVRSRSITGLAGKWKEGENVAEGFGVAIAPVSFFCVCALGSLLD